MNKEELHRFIDTYWDQATGKEPSQNIEVSFDEAVEEAPTRVLPEGKRVVRTKSSGDRVYFLDEEKKTRQWVTNPEVLESLGFKMEDVKDVEDIELLKYQMAAALYKPVVNE